MGWRLMAGVYDVLKTGRKSIPWKRMCQAP